MENENQIKVELSSFFGSDRGVAEFAWSSSYTKGVKESKTMEDVERVINMLAKEHHSTPFESIILRFWMRLPVATDRQLMTHRIASHGGMSGRYRTMPSEFLGIPEDVSLLLNRFNSPSYWHTEYIHSCREANIVYQDFCAAMKAGRDEGKLTNDEYKRLREFFRGILPQHNMTERVSIFNLRSWANFYRLRSDEHAQPEIRFIANEMYDKIKQIEDILLSVAALDKNSWMI